MVKLAGFRRGNNWETVFIHANAHGYGAPLLFQMAMPRIQAHSQLDGEWLHIFATA
jgi:hypothetical protein